VEEAEEAEAVVKLLMVTVAEEAEAAVALLLLAQKQLL
jgi:hypothetical protein